MEPGLYTSWVYPRRHRSAEGDGLYPVLPRAATRSAHCRAHMNQLAANERRATGGAEECLAPALRGGINETLVSIEVAVPAPNRVRPVCSRGVEKNGNWPLLGMRLQCSLSEIQITSDRAPPKTGASFCGDKDNFKHDCHNF